MAYNGYHFRRSTDHSLFTAERHLSEASKISDTNSINQRSRGRAALDSSDGRPVLLTPAEMHFHATKRRSLTTSHTPSLNQAAEELAKQVDASSSNVYDPPVPTTRCLQQFSKVVAREVDPDVKSAKDARLRAAITERKIHDETLSALRKWVALKEAESSWSSTINYCFNFWHHPRVPDTDQLVDLALYHYPLRGNVTVYVCEFGDN
jgi:hypothetical protein